MKIILESRLVKDPKTNTEKYVDGYFLTKDQILKALDFITPVAYSDETLNDWWRDFLIYYNDKSK